MMKEGSWWVGSISDPRWNKNGRGMVGMFSAGSGAQDWINQCKENFGEVPTDLTFGYMKD